MRVIVSGPAKWNGLLKENSKNVVQARKRIGEILKLNRDNHAHFEAASSLQLGLDTEFAEICIGLKIPLTVFLACKDQETMWDMEKQRRFQQILSKASSIHQPEGSYFENCIRQQMENISTWAIRDRKSLLILVRHKGLTKSQKERVTLFEDRNRNIQNVRIE